MSLVYVSAIITPAPEHAEAVHQALLAVVPPVRQEQGCIRYDLHCRRDSNNAITAFLFYEIWESAAALQAHSATDHLAAMRNAIQDKMAAETVVDVWEAVDVVD